VTEVPPPEKPADSRDPGVPSKPNFAGALLLGGLLVIAWGFNLAAALFGSTEPVVPAWLFYGLMGGILFLLGVDISKVFRGRGEP
jgi:hypothetical protein